MKVWKRKVIRKIEDGKKLKYWKKKCSLMTSEYIIYYYITENWKYRGIWIEYYNPWGNSYDKELLDILRNSYKMMVKIDDGKKNPDQENYMTGLWVEQKIKNIDILIDKF